MNPVAKITTNKGVIELELFADTMPITTENFMKLAEEGFYSGTKFHRVIEGFMVQGGDPNTKTDNVISYGSGGPGYAIADEHIKGEFLTNLRGTIAMANSGPQSGGSQFFINLVDNTFLDFDKEPLSSKHPVFGRVVGGMDIVDAIGQVEVNPGNNLPLEAIVVEKVEIVRS
ncbi:peptidylprolyl isomerase [Patescibacteria group bacterium]|nr:peptidylprolyl isomerase [Patescibacteria group bacterium]